MPSVDQDHPFNSQTGTPLPSLNPHTQTPSRFVPFGGDQVHDGSLLLTIVVAVYT